MKKIKQWIIFQFNTLWNSIHFWMKKREANKLHKLTGKQYFVVPASKTSLMVIDNSYVKWHNKIASKTKGMKKITHPQLLRDCYYKTPAGKYQR